MKKSPSLSRAGLFLGLIGGTAVGVVAVTSWPEAPRSPRSARAESSPVSVAPPAPTATPNVSAPPSKTTEGAVIPVTVAIAPAELARWKSPAFRATYRAKQKMKLAALFQDFFARNPCDPETRSRVLDLAVDQLTAYADTRLALGDAAPSSAEFARALGTTAADAAARLRQVLGEGRYNAFVEYEHSLPHRIELRGLEALLPEGGALEPSGYDQLLQQTQAARRRLEARLALAGSEESIRQAWETSDREIESAMIGRLTDRQMAALTKLHQEKRRLLAVGRQLEKIRSASSSH